MERKQQIGTFKWKEHTKHGNLNSDAETSNQKEPTNEFSENRGKKTRYNNAEHCIYTPNETKYKITVSALMHLIWCVCVQREDENGMKQNEEEKKQRRSHFFLLFLHLLNGCALLFGHLCLQCNFHLDMKFRCGICKLGPKDVCIHDTNKRVPMEDAIHCASKPNKKVKTTKRHSDFGDEKCTSTAKHGE